MSSEQLSVCPKLRAYVDAASGQCRHRKFFYLTLKKSGPQSAFDKFFAIPTVNASWKETIRTVMGLAGANNDT